MCLRWTAVLLALFTAAGCSIARVSTIPAAPVILTTVTWNTHSGRGDLQRMAEDFERGVFAPRSGDASLLMLQEVTAAEVEAIATPRRWTTMFVQVREGEEGMRGNAIVFSGDLRSRRAIPLPRERQPRVAAAASIELAGQELFVASVHLENRVSWWKGGLLSDTARHRQVMALLRAIPSDTSCIVGGDFNTWLGPTEAAWRALTARFDDTKEWPRTPTFANRLVLDHVLMDLPDGWRATRWVLPDNYGSDHHPVIGVVFE